MGTNESGRRPRERRWLGIVPARPPGFLAGQVLALICILIATVVRLLTATSMGGDSPYLFFVPLLLVAAVWGGYAAGATALVGSMTVATLLYAGSHPGQPLARYLWLAGTASVIGAMLVLVGGFMSATLRARARSENRFRSLVSATSLVVLRLDATAEILTPNADWRKLTGQDKEVSPGAWRRAFHPDDIGRLPVEPKGAVQAEARLKTAPTNDYRWVRLSLAPLDQGGAIVEWLGAIEDIHDRKSAEELTNTLAHELAHRAKNGFAVVQAIVAQSARHAESVDVLAQLIQTRLQAMALAQDVVSTDGREDAALDELMRRTLAPFGLERFDLKPGEPVILGRNLAMTLGLIFHELATNAVKYGALSIDGARVEIAADMDAKAGTAVVHWRERGGPEVKGSNSVGFGLRLLQNSLSSFGGAADVRMPPEGLECDLKFKV